MTANDAINQTIGLSAHIVKEYLKDFTDAELLHRPGPGCNHLAWQLGHLIASNAEILKDIAPHAVVALPAGFAEAHSKDKTASDNPKGFLSKAEYLRLYDAVNAATSAEAAKLSATDLDKPAPEKWLQYFPTVGMMFLLIATHPMMHAGQIVPVRRQLGKPIVM